MPRRILKGIVTSDKCDKTITVRVEGWSKHPLYGKIVRRSKKYMVHDPSNSYKVGEHVAISESRPYSRRKTWEVVVISQTLNEEGSLA